MAWLDGYRKRIACTARDSTGGSIEVTLTLPEWYDQFWETIDASGYGMRFTDSDGNTPLVYYRDSFDKAGRSGVVNAKNIVAAAGSTPTVFWLYYDPTASATDGASTFTPTTLVDAEVVQRVPPGTPIPAVAAAPGQTTPAHSTSKTSGEQVWVWWDVTDVFDEALGTTFQAKRYEEPARFTFSVQAAKTPVGSMFDVLQSGIVETDEGRRLIGAELKAGTDGTSYTGILTVHTCLPGAPDTIYRTLEFRVAIPVVDPDET